MIKGLRKFQQLPMLRSRDKARAPKCSASETTPCRPRDARSHVLRRRLRGQAPERLQRRPTTKTPWLGLETLARTYRGGDFVARLLNDFNGGQRPRPRGATSGGHRVRAPLAAACGVMDTSPQSISHALGHTSTTSAPCPRPRGAHARTAGSAPNVNDYGGQRPRPRG